jgi:hypothetical protein
VGDKITPDTLFPISLIIVIMSGVAGLTNIYAQTAENTKAIVELNHKQDEYNKNLLEVSIRLSRIEGALGVRRRHE